MPRKTILVFILMMFSQVLSIIDKTSLIFIHQQFERENIRKLELFSLIETHVIQNVTQRLYKNNYEDMSFDVHNYQVEVRLQDELAWIIYQMDETIYALLDYDFVFDAVQSYRYVSEEELPGFDTDPDEREIQIDNQEGED